MYYVMNPQSMKMSVTENGNGNGNGKTPVALLKKAAEYMTKRFMFNDKSKDVTHFMNLQGFKRWHRFNTREDMEAIMQIKSHIIDHYHEMPELVIEALDYNATDLKSHLDAWEDMDEKFITDLSQLKTDLIVPGNYHVEACLIQGILDKIFTELKYLERVKNELESEAYSAYCIHMMSHRIHDCYKGKEEELQHINIY